MSDLDGDIAQVLRDMAYIINESKDSAVITMLNGEIFVEAAEEIERLRRNQAKRPHIYAVVHHSRWLEEQEPKATVIYTHDGHKWHDICTCDPEWAEEIATALDLMSNRDDDQDSA